MNIQQTLSLLDEYNRTVQGHLRNPSSTTVHTLNLLHSKLRNGIIAGTLEKNESSREMKALREAERVIQAASVDRTKVELAGGKPITPDYQEINPATGQQKGYAVLSPEERHKGFVRPVRNSYVHLPCGTVTTMSDDLAETYARDPKFYSGTFCSYCRTHFPLDQFCWKGTSEVVGS